MNLQAKISSDVLVTTLVKSALKVRGLVLIPLLTLFIGVAEYGAFVQVLAIGIFTTNVFLLGLDSGYVRYIHDTDAPAQLYTSLLVFGTASTVVGGVLIGLGSDLLAIYSLRDQSFSALFLLGALYVPLNALFRLVRGYFRAGRRIKLYSALEAVDVYAGIAAIGFAVFVLETWIVGAFAAMLATRVLVITGTMLLIVRDGGIATPTVDGIRECLQFSLGTMGHLVSQSLLDKADKFLLGFFLGADAVGIYSAAYSIAYVILLYFRPLSVTFFPEFSKLWAENETESVRSYSVSGLRYLAILGVPSIAGLWIVGEDLLGLLSTQEVASSGALPLVVISAGLLAKGVGELYTQLFFAADDAKIPAVVQGATAASNIGLNVALIPAFGVLGAAGATVLSFVAGTTVLAAWFQRYLRVLPRLTHLLHVGISTAVMVGILGVLQQLLPWPVTILLGVLVYFSTLLAVGGISREEARLVVEITTRTVGRSNS